MVASVYGERSLTSLRKVMFKLRVPRATREQAWYTPEGIESSLRYGLLWGSGGSPGFPTVPFHCLDAEWGFFKRWRLPFSWIIRTSVSSWHKAMPLLCGKIIFRYGSSLYELGRLFSIQSQLAGVGFGPQPDFGKLFFIPDIYGQCKFPSIEPFFHTLHASLVCGRVLRVSWSF